MQTLDEGGFTAHQTRQFLPRSVFQYDLEIFQQQERLLIYRRALDDRLQQKFIFAYPVTEVIVLVILFQGHARRLNRRYIPNPRMSAAVLESALLRAENLQQVVRLALLFARAPDVAELEPGTVERQSVEQRIPFVILILAARLHIDLMLPIDRILRRLKEGVGQRPRKFRPPRRSEILIRQTGKVIYGRLAVRLVVETAQNVAVDLLEIAHDPLCALRGIRFLHEVDRHRRLETGKRGGLLNILDLIETHKHAAEDVVELLVQNMCIEHVLLQIRLELLIEAAEIMRLPFKILIEIRRQFRQLRQRFSEPVDFIGGDIVVCKMAHVFLFLRVRHVSLILPQPTQT